MKCKWYADFEGVCTNGECPYRGDTCPTSEHPDVCKYADATQKPELNAEELVTALRICAGSACERCSCVHIMESNNNYDDYVKRKNADMLERLAAEKDAQKPEWIEQQRTAISAIETCRQLKKSLFGKENVTNDELVRTVFQLKSGRWIPEKEIEHENA